MFDKNTVVNDYIPYDYTLMDFLIDIDVNKYDKIITGDNLNHDDISKNEQTLSYNGFLIETPITINLNYPIYGKNNFSQVVFKPFTLNKGENFEELLVKLFDSFVMEKNTYTVKTFKNDEEIIEEEQLPYYRYVNKYNHPFLKRLITYISERYSFLKIENKLKFMTISGDEIDKPELLRRINSYISNNIKSIIKEAQEYDKAVLLRNQTIQTHMSLEFESASFGSLLSFEKPESKEMQYALVMVNTELSERKPVTIALKLDGDGNARSAKIERNKFYDIQKSFANNRPISINLDQDYEVFKNFLDTIHYVHTPDPCRPIPANVFAVCVDGGDTDNLKWLMYDYIQNEEENNI